MTYRPSLTDISDVSSSQGTYRPTLKDISSDISLPIDERQQMKQMVSNVIGVQTDPVGNLQDFLYGVGKAGAGIAGTLTGGYAPPMPDIRQQHPNVASTALGQYLPFAVAGGPSLLGSTLGAGAFGATQYEPEQRGIIDTVINQTTGIPYGGRTRNAIEDALLNMIFHGFTGPIAKMTGKAEAPQASQIDFRNKVEFPSSESEFTNVPLEAPSFLKQKQEAPLSERISEDITSNVMGNRNLEQSGQQLATNINRTYQNIKNKHSQEFNTIFDSPTGEISYQTGEPILVKDKLMTKSKYRDSDYLSDTQDKNLKILNDKFNNDPSIKNAHELQSELGSEIGYLKRQRDKELLDAEGKNRLGNYVNAQNLLQQDIRDQLNSIDPELMRKYDITREDWRKNVIPYHSDKDLREIAEGRIKNPESGKIINIFKNPEENINKVSGDLDKTAKDNILHLALGKTKEDLTPEQLLNARRSLDINGMSTYINPEHEQSFRALRSNLQLEKQKQQQKAIDEAFVKELKNAQERIEGERISAAKKREAKFEKAQKESEKIFESFQKNINTDYQKGLVEQLAKQKYRKDFLKNILFKGAAVAAVSELGLNQAEILAAYLAKLPKTPSKKK